VNACITRDTELIKSMMMDVGHLAFEDGANKVDWNPEMGMGNGWLLIECKATPVALCKIRIVQARTIEIHPYAMPGHSSKWRNIVECILKWIYDSEKVEKVIAFVGVCHRLTYKLALKIGFQDEGLSRKSYFKNGEMLDQHLIGITRQEIGEIL